MVTAPRSLHDCFVVLRTYVVGVERVDQPTGKSRRASNRNRLYTAMNDTLGLVMRARQRSFRVRTLLGCEEEKVGLASSFETNCGTVFFQSLPFSVRVCFC